MMRIPNHDGEDLIHTDRRELSVDPSDLHRLQDRKDGLTPGTVQHPKSRQEIPSEEEGLLSGLATGLRLLWMGGGGERWVEFLGRGSMNAVAAVAVDVVAIAAAAVVGRGYGLI